MKKTFTETFGGKGKLIILEGADGCGKTTLAKKLRTSLQSRGEKVVISGWKDGKYFADFFNEHSRIKRKKMIHSRAHLMLQVADLLYRLEKVVIPALAQGKTVILDRGLETVYVRGYSIGFTHDQIESGLLWSIKHIYQSLFEEGQTIYLQATTSETLERLAGRSVGTDDAQVNEGTLIGLHMISSLSYTPDGEKMTLAKKRSLIQQIQGNMIRQYDEIFSSETSATVIDGNLSESEVFSQALAVLS